jgi:hypothetical protein
MWLFYVQYLGGGESDKINLYPVLELLAAVPLSPLVQCTWITTMCALGVKTKDKSNGDFL